MRKTIFIALFACLPFFSFSQPLHTWPTDNSWWVITDYDVYGYLPGRQSYYYLDGDTLIGGKTYQVVSGYDALANNYYYRCATRTDSSYKVWIVLQDSVDEILLYDFDVNVGDTIRDVYNTQFGFSNVTSDLVVVQTFTSNSYGDGDHRIIRLDLIGGSGFGYWIDGVGDIRGPFYPGYIPDSDDGQAITCMIRDHVIVKSSPYCEVVSAQNAITIQINVFPNPSYDIVQIESDAAHIGLNAELRDVKGRLINRWDKLPHEIDMRALPNGAYFLLVSGKNTVLTRKILKH